MVSLVIHFIKIHLAVHICFVHFSGNMCFIFLSQISFKRRTTSKYFSSCSNGVVHLWLPTNSGEICKPSGIQAAGYGEKHKIRSFPEIPDHSKSIVITFHVVETSPQVYIGEIVNLLTPIIVDILDTLDTHIFFDIHNISPLTDHQIYATPTSTT